MKRGEMLDIMVKSYLEITETKQTTQNVMEYILNEMEVAGMTPPAYDYFEGWLRRDWELENEKR